MAEHNRKQNEHGTDRNEQSQSIGNQQQTTQTGAQNSRGKNVDEREDQYTEDLQRSGKKNSSNRNEGS